MKRAADFPRAVAWSYLGVISMYLPVSILGFVTYGKDIESNILLSIKHDHSAANSVILDIVLALITAHLLFSFVIVVNPVSQQFEALFKIPQSKSAHRALSDTAEIGQRSSRVNSVKVEINFTSSASSIFLVHNLYCDKCSDKYCDSDRHEKGPSAVSGGGVGWGFHSLTCPKKYLTPPGRVFVEAMLAPLAHHVLHPVCRRAHPEVWSHSLADRRVDGHGFNVRLSLPVLLESQGAHSAAHQGLAVGAHSNWYYRWNRLHLFGHQRYS